jgi:hypothetical protein
MQHVGRHAHEYHDWILNRLKMIDKMSNGNVDLFMKNFEIYIKEPVRNNPPMLYSDFWRSNSSFK